MRDALSSRSGAADEPNAIYLLTVRRRDLDLRFVPATVLRGIPLAVDRGGVRSCFGSPHVQLLSEVPDSLWTVAGEVSSLFGIVLQIVQFHPIVFVVMNQLPLPGPQDVVGNHDQLHLG